MKKIIVTVGPSTLHQIESMECSSHICSYIYRINAAHGCISDIERTIEDIKKRVPEAEIYLDLPGNKIRTTNLDQPIALEVNGKFELGGHQINYRDFHRLIKPGDVVLAQDSTLKFIVEEVNEERITFRSKSEGQLLNNKGLHVRGIHKDIPFFFQKDLELIEIANKYKVSYVALSFVRNVADIELAKKLIDKGILIFAKIETKAAVENLNEILQSVEYINVDRGDLSTEVGLEKVPSYQKFIVEKALFYNKKVFLATQFLKNMQYNPIPTIAEIIDLYNTFKMGIYGIQLSEETAIGKYPRECLEIIERVIDEINSEIK